MILSGCLWGPTALGLSGLSLTQPLRVRWEYQTARTLNLTPAIHEDTLYLPLTAGEMLCLRVFDGKLLWKEETGGEFSAAPLADGRGVYVASSTGGETKTQGPRATGAIRALSRTSGVTLWMRTLPSPIRGSLVAKEKILFGGAEDGRVYALSKETGALLWVAQFKSPFASQLIVHEDRLYLGSEDGTLYALQQATGRLAWRYRTRGALRGAVAVAEQNIFFGSADHYVYAVSQVDGRLRWRSRTGAAVQAVTQSPRGLLVASLDNFVYLISTRHGDRIWKRQLAGRIAAQPLTAPDGALFAPMAGDACVVLDLQDGKLLNTLPVGEGNNMAAAPVLSEARLIVTTRRGLLAFAAPDPHSSEKK